MSVRSNEKIEPLRQQLGVEVTHDNAHVVKNADIVFITVKPQDIRAALLPLADQWQPHQCIVSAAAGWRLSTLQTLISNGHLARITCNTAVRIGEGVVGIYSEHEGTDAMLQKLLSPLGLVQSCKTEHALETLMIATASGPGWLFEWLAHMQAWLMQQGWPPTDAQILLTKMVVGIGTLSHRLADLSFETLQAQITSKGGLTQAGLDIYRQAHLQKTVADACEAALKRNADLSDQS